MRGDERGGGAGRGKITVEGQIWRIKPEWRGETCAIIASGPSLEEKDVEFVKGKARCIVVNDNYRLAPWADILYAADTNWWDWHNGAPGFKGVKATVSQSAAKKYGLRWLRYNDPDKPGLELEDSTCIRTGYTGGNSGLQAINVAAHLGVERIVLLGFDMKSNGANHWFGEHPNHTPGAKTDKYLRFRKATAQTVPDLKAAGIEVINCTRDTALECFPRQELRDVL